MTTPRVTDHAVLRYLQRVGGVDVEGFRELMTAACARAVAAAGARGLTRCVVVADVAGARCKLVVRDGAVVTVHDRRWLGSVHGPEVAAVPGAQR